MFRAACATSAEYVGSHSLEDIDVDDGACVGARFDAACSNYLLEVMASQSSIWSGSVLK